MRTRNITYTILACLLLAMGLQGCASDVQRSAKADAEPNDGYNKAVMEGRGWESFDLQKVTLFPDDNFPGVEIMEMNARQLNELAQQRDSLWVVCWATWCGTCLGDIPNYVALAKKKPGLKLVYIATNYDVAGIQKYLGRNGYSGTAFIIPSSDYSANQLQKLNLFNAEAAGKLAEPVGGVPVNMVYLHGKVVSWKGSSMTPEAFEAIFN